MPAESIRTLRRLLELERENWTISTWTSEIEAVLREAFKPP
jgi:hypothetical protein